MNRPVVISLIGLAAATLAIVLALSLEGDDSDVAAAPAAIAMLPPAPAAEENRDPSFDVVRIGDKGDAVIAGRAMPQAEVAVLDGDRELGRAVADNRGEWVFVPAEPLLPGVRQLGLRALNPDGTATQGEAPVLLVVPARPGEPPLAVKPLKQGGAKLLLGPVADAGSLTLEMVDRDDRAGLTMSGHARPETFVHLYLDGRFLGRGAVDETGAWQVAAKLPAKSGRTLRADMVDERGKVLARVEAPYEAGQELRLAEGAALKLDAGPSLWRLVRRAGAGQAFTVIYDAGQAAGRDPDRVYPGQVFVPPK